MIFTPRKYQVITAEHIFKNPRCPIWAGMGMGKTSTCLHVVDTLKLIDASKTLALAPLRVAQSTWPDEVKKWENFSDLKIVPIVGDAKQRVEALREPADIHTTNYENLPWLCEQVGENWQWGNVIADEATRLKSFRLGGKKGTRAKALSKVAFKKVNRFIELTGTPSPNGLQDLWGQMWFIDQGLRLGRTYTSFINRWFTYNRDGFSTSPMPHAYDEIMARLSDIALSVRAEDWFDIKAPVIVDVPVKLPPKARELYKQMEKEMFFEIENNSVEAFTAAAKTMKCLQIANGAVYLDESKKWSPVHDAKLDALESIIEESGGAPILCAYHFKSDLERLKKRFPQGVELDKNPSTINKWNAGKIPILFAHPASAGHGLNLQDGGNIVVMFGHWWDLEQYQQIIERIGPTRQLQAGHNRAVYIYNIRAVGTVDDLVIQSRTNKRKVQDLLLESARKL